MSWLPVRRFHQVRAFIIQFGAVTFTSDRPESAAMSANTDSMAKAPKSGWRSRAAQSPHMWMAGGCGTDQDRTPRRSEMDLLASREFRRTLTQGLSHDAGISPSNARYPTGSSHLVALTSDIWIMTQIICSSHDNSRPTRPILSFTFTTNRYSCG